MKSVLIVITAVLLSGCGILKQAPTAAAPVYVPVPIECRVQVPARPVMATDSLQLLDALDRKVKAALAELEEREAYEIELRAALSVCTAPISSTTER